MENIVLSYPWWFVLLCLVLGAIYAILLYARNPHFADKPGLNSLLAILRGAAVSLIAFLLLNPVVKHIEEYLKPPILVIGIDQSTSVGEKISDSTTFSQNLNQLIDQMDDKYEVQVKSIGNGVSDTLSINYSQSETDLSAFLEYVNDQYSHLNLSGVVMASDGIFNKGKHPLYIQKKFTAPLHTILMGDTSLPKDINVKTIFHNDVAFLGDRFEIEVDVEAQHCAGSNSSIELMAYEGGKFKLLEKHSIRWATNQDFHTKSFLVQANTPGVRRYQVRVSSIGDEENKRNNRRDFFVEILDSRKKIVVVKRAPHPDIGAIKSLAQGQNNLELVITNSADAAREIPSADLIIWHDLPSIGDKAIDLLALAKKSKIPGLFIMGSQTDLGLLNKAQTVVSIVAGTRASNEVQPQFDPNFELFNIDEKATKLFSEAPPLEAPFGEYSLGGGAMVLAKQEINRIATEFPLIAFAERNGVKEGAICGTGIWRWRIADYYQNKTFEAFDGLIGSIIQYLSLKENREQFRVKTSKNIYDENEEINFTAEVYNANFESIIQPEVTLSMRSQSGDRYEFTFSRDQDRYVLNAGNLPAGSYSYTAQTTHSGKKWTQRGQFVVQAIELEYYNTVADHSLLKSLSDQTGGRSYSMSELPQLSKFLTDQEVKPVLDFQTQSLSLIHLKWILLMIALLLIGEWFLRRYYGRY